tara:strand:- start:13820 stop:14356 length:537 start_codon:yes stop_codon:yes gene_type:complete
MYQDINKQTGFRNLQGNQFLYANLKLLSPSELDGALADGITTYTKPTPSLPTEAQQLATAQSYKGAEIQAGYDYANTLDIDYMATTFQADKDSQDLVVSVLSAGVVPEGFYWLDALNNQVLMTYAELQGLSQTLLMRGQINFGTRLALKNANKATTTVAEVDAVTLPASWIEPVEEFI